MITETEARELLGRAAGTIGVPPGRPLPEAASPRRWVVPLAAAAAVIAAVAAGLIMIDRNGTAEPSPAPAIDNRIPSVFAYDDATATQMLRDRGLKVVRKIEEGCAEAPNRALGTTPKAGTPFEAGDRVVLTISRMGQAESCADTTIDRIFAWELFDYANGRGADPGLNRDTRFYLNGRVADRATLLATLAALTRDRANRASLSVVPDGVAPCGREAVEGLTPDNLPGKTRHSWSITHSGRHSVTDCNVVTEVRRGLEITAVFVHAERLPDQPQPSADPDGVGASFVRFSQGGAAPAFAPKVRLYFDGRQVRTLTAERAADRSSWWVCFSEMVSNCPLLTEIAAAARPDLTYDRADPKECPLATHTLPLSTWHYVTIRPSPGLCTDSAVQVFYDDQGRITAADFEPGRE